MSVVMANHMIVAFMFYGGVRWFILMFVVSEQNLRFLERYSLLSEHRS
jgi:hypothetical protein